MGDLNRGTYRGWKLIEKLMKVMERLLEGSIRQRIEIDEMRRGFMSGRGTTDAVLLHGVQHRMISVDNFFRIFEIFIFCFAVAICDLVHAVEATIGIP